MATWTPEEIDKKLETSGAWVMRAIFKLSDDFHLIAKETLSENAINDKTFLDGFKKFFIENGVFTDRQIHLARIKIRRPEYIAYLAQVASS